MISFTARGIYRIEAYCENPACPAREAEITVKLHNDQEIAVLNAAVLRCVICHKPPTVHWVEVVVPTSEALKRAEEASR